MPGLAGPWPREKGQLFTAVTSTYRYAPDIGVLDSEGGFYLEYGLGDRLTIGIDAMDDLASYSHAYGFARWAIGPPEQTWKLAVSVGAGASRRGADWGAMGRFAVSTGRSYKLWRPGWLAITAAIEDHAVWSDPTYKLDATVGLHISDRVLTFVDLETSRRTGVPDAITLRGSLAWQAWGENHLIIGVEAKDVGIRFYGIRAGFWTRF